METKKWFRVVSHSLKWLKLNNFYLNFNPATPQLVILHYVYHRSGIRVEGKNQILCYHSKQERDGIFGNDIQYR